MTTSDETLMAYADGELDAAAAALVAAAERDDPTIAARIAEHRALRARLRASFAAELDEPVPERLLAAARRPPAPATRAKVADIDAARARRVGPRWRPLLAVAASLAVGIGVGLVAWHRSDSMLTLNSRGALVADGSLAQALSSNFAGRRSARERVEIGLSFLSRSGTYCRTFNVARAVSRAGVACREGADWQIEVLTQGAGAAGPRSEYRTANSSLPPAILGTVEAQIAGQPLDHQGEVAARQNGWQVKAR